MIKLAWEVWGWEDAAYPSQDISTIVFAEDEDSALEAGYHKGYYASSDDLVPRRTPEYDQYADLGYVPPMVLLEKGWVFSCNQCGTRVDEENEQEMPLDIESEEDYYYPDPISEGSEVYCSTDCYINYLESWRTIRKHRKAAREYVLLHYPLLTDMHVYGGGRDYKVFVDFDFGGKHAMNVVFDAEAGKLEQFSVRIQDLEAWDMFVEDCQELIRDLAV